MSGEKNLIRGYWSEAGQLELFLPDDAPEGAAIRYCFPWDGPRLLFIQGEYLAPVACDAGTEIRCRIFLGKRGISETQSFVKPGDFPDHPTPKILISRTQNRDFMAYDWGARHKAVCRTVAKRRPGLLMLGDSITHFWGGEPYDSSPLDYVTTAPDLWLDCLERFNPVNLGFGNDRVENALWRVEHGELDKAAPDATCVILIGTNNLSDSEPEDIASGIVALCNAVRERLPGGSILVQGIYPRGDQDAGVLKRLAITNAMIRSALLAAGNLAWRYVDVGYVLEDGTGRLKPGLTRDGLHPTCEGYEALTRVLIPEIERLSCPA